MIVIRRYYSSLVSFLMMNSGGGKGARIVLKGIKRNVEKRRVYNGSEVLIDALNPVEDVVCETY